MSCNIDWSLCVICQNASSNERLQCPANETFRRADIGSGYSTVAENLIAFKELGVVTPVTQNSEDSKLQDVLSVNKGKWHKSCALKYNKTKLERLRKRSHEDDSEHHSSQRKSLRMDSATNPECRKCFFCDSESSDLPLHSVTTFEVDRRVRKVAVENEDKAILAKLSAGDMIAIEAVYHAKCLSSYYNKSRPKQRSPFNAEGTLHGIALAEILNHLNEEKGEHGAKVFKLADLTKMYANRLEQLGVEITGRIHSTDFKNRLLSSCADLVSYNSGREVFIAFREDVGSVLSNAYVDDGDDEGLYLSKAAHILRREILGTDSHFSGNFDQNSQKESIPRTLLTFVSMIINGSHLTMKQDHEKIAEQQASLSLSQLLLFNTSKRRRQLCNPKSERHNKNREPPLPIYVGLMVYSQTRQSNMVNKLFDLGVSVSYERVLEIEDNAALNICAQFNEEQVVCPPNLRKGLFTTAAYDNLDHNPSSTTSKESFHGTGISLFQHPDAAFLGEVRNAAIASNSAATSFPDEYRDFAPAMLKDKDPPIPALETWKTKESHLYPDSFLTEQNWLECVRSQLTDESVAGNLSWSSYHATRIDQSRIVKSISSLLPLFKEDSHSVALMCHSMQIVKKTITFLNPGQVPVMTFDQPLYAIAKKIQWTWPELLGEDQMVVVLGGLHIEMAFMTVIGDWLKDSGWIEALEEAGLTTSGKAESFLHCAHVKRTRYAHEVTACAIYSLLKDAYNLQVDTDTDFETFCNRRMEIPQFQFWYMALQKEILLFLFVRSFREGNFQLYVDTLCKMAPWFFALDKVNYSRWLPVHIRDMQSLEKKHPDVYQKFSEGKFVVHNSQRNFSSIAIDQAHEQNNKRVKGEGGIIGLTSNESALNRWILSGPQISELVAMFESSMLPEPSGKETAKHHEQNPAFQKKFAENVRALIQTIQENGNPFLEDSRDALVSINDGKLQTGTAVKNLQSMEDAGLKQYNDFMLKRLLKPTQPLSDTIPKNSLYIFSAPKGRQKKKQPQIANLKNNVALFSRLFIACQNRDGDLEEFFRHENQSYPPSIAHNNELRSGNKADLVKYLESKVTSAIQTTVAGHDAVILDGAAIINGLRPVVNSTFQDYASGIFLPHVNKILRRVSRLDVVFDVYLKDSLKNTARLHRGEGFRKRVKDNFKVPSNWQSFLRNSDNKTELFSYLATYLHNNLQPEDKTIIVTHASNVFMWPQQESHELEPCNHEEADTRIFLHVQDAYHRKGYERVVIHTVDTDVVVLAISMVARLERLNLTVAFGLGKYFRYININSFADFLGKEKSLAIPVFHAFTGCDTVSFFSGRGKKSALDLWLNHSDITEALSNLANDPATITNETLLSLEQFVVLLYDRTSDTQSVNAARLALFAHKNRIIENIPPTQAALINHLQRAALQANCWMQMLVSMQDLPDPELCGWERVDEQWQPKWSSLPAVGDTVRSILLQCGCKKKCGGACRCKKADLPCTALCFCAGGCG